MVKEIFQSRGQSTATETNSCFWEDTLFWSAGMYVIDSAKKGGLSFSLSRPWRGNETRPSKAIPHEFIREHNTAFGVCLLQPLRLYADPSLAFFVQRPVFDIKGRKCHAGAICSSTLLSRDSAPFCDFL